MPFSEIPQLVISGVLLGSLYSLLALGISLVFGIMKIVNLAHGDFMVLASYISFWLVALLGFNPFATLLISIPTLFAVGFVTQKVLTGRAVARNLDAAVLATYGVALIVSNSERLAWTPNPRLIQTSFSYSSIQLGSITMDVPRILTLVASVLIAVLLSLLMNRTDFGKAMGACTQDREAASLLGINYERIATITFGMSAAIAAVAGLLYTLATLTSPSVGISLTIQAFIVLMLGGAGGIYPALFGGFVLGIIENVGSFYIGGAYQEVVGFVALLVILVVRPTGLFGKRHG